jgi:hypothetical protein
MSLEGVSHYHDRHEILALRIIQFRVGKSILLLVAEMPELQ